MMNKEETTKSRYCIQWNAHEKYMCNVLCSLMEHQSLVDLAICCGSNTIHAHKCILAANSPYFREQLEKNTNAEQVIISGLDFIIIKSIIEFIYCGETNVSEENMKYMIAAAKVFQIRGLQALVAEGDIPSTNTDQIHIPPPVFISKKPKYPTAFRPFNNFCASPQTLTKAFISNDQFLQRKMKRKYIRSEAERACAKEAAASRLALEALQKELATAPQVNQFVIEESCTETTVENFIPHTEETFIENLNGIPGVQVVNYGDLNYPSAAHIMGIEKTFAANPLLQFGLHNRRPNLENDTTTDKIKHILGSDLPNNVEIMFKTSDGNFVSVTDEVLQNITKGALQYQVIDENGHAGEIQELRVLDKGILGTGGDNISEEFINTATSSQNSISGYVNEDSKLLLSTLSETSGIEPLENSVTETAEHVVLEKHLGSENISGFPKESQGLDLSSKPDEPSSFLNGNELGSVLSHGEPIKGETNDDELLVPIAPNNSPAEDTELNVNNAELMVDHDGDLGITFKTSEVNIAEDVIEAKKIKLDIIEEPDPDHVSEFVHSVREFSPRKTRSNFRMSGASDPLISEVQNLVCEESLELKKEKTKRVMPCRKRK